MAYTKQGFKSGDKLYATQLNAMDDQIAANKVDVDAANRNADALFKINEGQTYDFQEQTETSYAESPLSGSRYANLEMLSGMSRVWNQLIINGNFESLNEWDADRGTGSVADNVYSLELTAVGTGYLQGGIRKSYTMNLIKDHKYYVHYGVYTPRDASVGFTTENNSISSIANPITGNVWTTMEHILTAASDITNKSFWIGINQASTYSFEVGDVIKFREVYVVDLTKLYGSGNEPTVTTDDKISMIETYAAAHPEYNAGEIISADVSKVESVGKNLLNTQNVIFTNPSNTTSTPDTKRTFTKGTWVKGLAKNNYYNSSYVQQVSFDGGSVYLQASLGYGIAYVTHLKAGDSVCFQYTIDSTNESSVALMLYDKDGEFIGLYEEGAQTIKDGAEYVLVAFVHSYKEGTNAVKYTVMVEKGSAPTDFVPYMNDTRTVPATSLNLKGINDSCYDYVDLVPKTYHNMKSVDLGTLNWEYLASVKGFVGIMPSDSANVAVKVSINAFCSKYELGYDYTKAYGHNKTMVVNNLEFSSSKKIVIWDYDYTDATAFKAAVSGVILHYEASDDSGTDYEAKLLHRRVGTVTLNGTEKWNKYGDRSVWYSEGIFPSSAVAISNKLSTVTAVWSNLQDNAFSIHSSGNVYIHITDSITTNAEFIAWLTENTPTFYYAYAQEQLLDVTDLFQNYPTDLIKCESGGTITYRNDDDAKMIETPHTQEYVVALSEVNG